MEDSARIEDRRAGARRTLTALVITVSALFVGAILFMIVRGDQSAPEARRVLAVLPFQGPSSEAGPGRYEGFAESLAAYFGRADPNVLYVFGPASTSVLVEAGDDPLEVGSTLGANLVLVGREASRALAATLVVELYRVDDGTVLWRGDYDVGPNLDRRALLVQVSTEATEALDLPR